MICQRAVVGISLVIGLHWKWHGNMPYMETSNADQ